MVKKCWWFWCSISEKIPIGYFFEVDLEYPDELHELHELHYHYPLAPEKLAVSSNMLSNYCKKFVWDIWDKSWWCKKLIPNLGNKTNYVGHYRNH